MKVAVVGIGLIGGSMALDIKAVFENVEIIGIDRDGDGKPDVYAYDYDEDGKIDEYKKAA